MKCLTIRQPGLTPVDSLTPPALEVTAQALVTTLQYPCSASTSFWLSNLARAISASERSSAVRPADHPSRQATCISLRADLTRNARSSITAM